MALFTKTDTTWRSRAPGLVASIEAFRESAVAWGDAAAQASQSRAPGDMSRAGIAALDLQRRYASARLAFNEFFDLPHEEQGKAYWASPQQLVVLGAKAMLGEVETQVTAFASRFHPDDEYRSASEAVLDLSWTRYTHVYGPVDEQAQGRLWKPRDVAACLEMAGFLLEVSNPFNARWAASAAWVLEAHRAATA